MTVRPRAFGPRSLAVPLLAAALAFGLSARPADRRAAAASQYVDCGDAQWYVGANIPDTRDIPSGDIVRVDAIRRIASPATPGPGGAVFPRYTLGYRYTLKDGRAYVADRGRGAVSIDSLAIMNQVVNDMSKFEGNAFDPRDGGAKVYKVAWNPAVAKRMGLETAACPPRPMRG